MDLNSSIADFTAPIILLQVGKQTKQTNYSTNVSTTRISILMYY